MSDLPATKKASFDDFLTQLIDNPTDDDLELLGDLKPITQKPTKMMSGQAALLEINLFIDKNNRKPDADSSDFSEASLARRMNGYAKYAAEHKDLKPFDKYDLIDSSLYKEIAAPVFTPEPEPTGLLENAAPVSLHDNVADNPATASFDEALSDTPELTVGYLDSLDSDDLIDREPIYELDLHEQLLSSEFIESGNAQLDDYFHNINNALGFEVDFLAGEYDKTTSDDFIAPALSNPLFFISIDGDFDRFVSIPRYMPSHVFDITYPKIDTPLPEPSEFLFDLSYTSSRSPATKADEVVIEAAKPLTTHAIIDNIDAQAAYTPSNGNLSEPKTTKSQEIPPSEGGAYNTSITAPKSKNSPLERNTERSTLTRQPSKPAIDTLDSADGGTPQPNPPAETVDAESTPVAAKGLVVDEDIPSLDDILDNDDGFLMDLLADEESYFVIDEATQASIDRAATDEVGKQKPCEDFYKYKSYFSDLHNKLASGDLKVIPHTAVNFKAGDAFVLSGITGFIQKVGEARINSQGQNDPRLRVIYDNGTESNILLSSLNKTLYMDARGSRVVRGADDFTDFDTPDATNSIRTGQIYIVRSLSDDPVVQERRNLYKIGFTTKDVCARIKGAERDIAFLEAPVEVVLTVDCYDLDPRGLEGLIHTFLCAQRLQITLTSKNGNIYHPKEWFTVDLQDAKKIIGYIIDGTIHNYRMDKIAGKLVDK